MFRKIIQSFFVFIIFAAAAFIDARFIEPNLLLVKNESLYLPNWDEKLNGLRVAVVSDIHIGTKTVNLKKLEKIAAKVNKNNPDLIVFLGDFDSKTIKSSKYTNKELSDIFKRFKARYGVFSILGNHDYHSPGPNDIKTFLNNANVKVLENTSDYIYANDCRIKIIGFKDLWYFNLDPKKLVGRVASPAIVLMHNPDSFVEMPKAVSLSLSGHTHGGEIVLPFLGSPIVPSEYGQRYRKGHIIEGGKHLYVSGGVATLSGFRLLNPPEISILTLFAQNDKTKILNTKPRKGFTKKHWKKSIEILRNIRML